MKKLSKWPARLWAYGFGLLLLAWGALGQAQTSFTQGLDYDNNGTATLWFQGANVSWVDIHYNAGQGQQNLRMTFNAGAQRFETSFTAAAGTWVNYSFTYNINGLAYDTSSYSAQVQATSSSSSSSSSSLPSSSSSLSSSSSSSSVSGPTQGVDDLGSSLVLWFTSSPQAAWADVHYNLNNTGQQNFRTSFNSQANRFEQVVAVNAGVAVNVSYSFTYMSPVGAVDSPVSSYTRSSSSSAVSSSSSSSSSSSDVSSSSSSSIIVSSSSSSLSSSSSSQAAFVQGTAEMGSSLTVWFKAPVPQAFVILHYSITHNGAAGGQINPQMNYNAPLDRWEMTISPTTRDDIFNYSFTYQDAQGNQDSPWFSCVIGSCGSTVTKPLFAPEGGIYSSMPCVQLATLEAQGEIHYTLDGSAPNINSPIYISEICPSVNALTINAITVLADGQESGIASQTYSLNDSDETLPAPLFSHTSGSYDTVIRVTINSQRNGAYVHYTLDGSTPDINSPVYTAPIELKIDDTKTPAVDSYQLKAVSIKAGVGSSTVASANYHITANNHSSWNGLTTFNVVNTTNKYPDDQVYWAIIGKDWNTGNFVHVDMNGNLIPMSLGDNGALMKNGKPYANYFYSLAQTKSITIPAINSARLLMSVGSPMYIWVNQDINGKIAYAGANIENPDDPNIDVTFDFGEFAILPSTNWLQGIFINTTRVDHFGFPVQLTVTGLDGFKQTVGESLSETRDEIFARFINETPAEFGDLARTPYAPYRIMAPAHASFQNGGQNANYLDDYISAVWDQYRNQDLVLNLHNGWPTFTGRVQGDTFVFTDGQGTYRINGKPSTSMVMLGNGLLDDKTGASSQNEIDKQLQLQAQVCAALNRHVAHLSGDSWYDYTQFFAAGSKANYFTKFFHDHALNGLTYGFSYDDVGGYSPSIYTPSPVSVTYTIGKFNE